MNLFEYLTVAISIVLSMSIVRSLENFGDVNDPARRDRLHFTWFAVKASQPALLWWTIWGLHDLENWNYAAFLACLAAPVFLFFQITTLTTREPDEVQDWGAHFMACRTRFFAGAMAQALAGPILLVALGLFEQLPVILGGVAVDLVISIIGIRSESRRVHGALVTCVVFEFIVWTVLLYRPL